MDDLIEALQILKRYTTTTTPFHCEHDALYICDVDPSDVSEEDKVRLYKLGFFIESEESYPSFMSYRYGSC